MPGPADLLQAPTIQPTRIGLLRSAGTFPEGTRWHGGISYRPDDLTPATVPNSTYAPCDGPGAISPADTAAVSWEPWGIVVSEECLSAATDEADERARAERQLEAQTEHLLSRTFWSGEVGATDFAALGWGNIPLADANATVLTSTGPIGVISAFSLAIDYLHDTIGSVRGMIHVPPLLAPFMAYYQVAIRDAFQLVTALADHVVVMGSGYLGTAPDGSAAGAGTTWIYVTSMVRAATSAIFSHAALNRSDNDIEAQAYRLVIAEWDLQAHAAIQICLPDPSPDCAEWPS